VEFEFFCVFVIQKATEIAPVRRSGTVHPTCGWDVRTPRLHNMSYSAEENAQNDRNPLAGEAAIDDNIYHPILSNSRNFGLLF